MELNIINFRGIKNLNLEFPLAKTLLKGKSGAGKSSILESIKWCLYGSMRNVTNIENKSFTSVRFKIKNIIIKRERTPEIVSVNIDNLFLENKEAQDYIDKYFGDKKIWQNSSYIAQNERNILLNGSSQEKLELIKNLIFKEEECKYDKLINIFQEKIPSLDNNYEYLNKDLVKIKEKIDKFKEENKDILSYYTKASKASKLFKNKEKLFNNYEKLTKELILIDEQKTINRLFEEYNKNIIEYQKILDKYPSKLTSENIRKWNCYIENKENLELMKNNYNETSEELDNLLLINSKLQYNITISKNLEIDIKDLYTYKQQIFKDYDKIQVWQHYQNINEKYIKVNDDYEKYLTFNKQLVNINEGINKLWKWCMNKIKEEYKDYDKSILFVCKNKLQQIEKDSLICPECKANLLLENNKLVNKHINLEKEEILTIKKNLDKVENYYKNLEDSKQKIDNLHDKISALKPKNIIENPKLNEADILKKMNILKNYQHIDENSDNIVERIKQVKYREKIEKIEKIVNLNYQQEFDNISVPDNFDEYYQIYNRNYFKLQENKKFIDNHIRKEIIDKGKNKKLTEKIKLELDKLDIYEKCIEKYKELDILIKEQDKIKQEVTTVMEDLNSCKKIINVIRISENETYDNFLDNFNIILSDILNIIFPELTLELTAFKEFKQKKITKAQINFDIIMNGIVYDNLNSLSGGEKDRVSLALTLSISFIRDSPMLLLDECMASLDSDNRRSCLKLINNLIKNKVVLNVCHETIEGYYDNLCDISNYSPQD